MQDSSIIEISLLQLRVSQCKSMGSYFRDAFTQDLLIFIDEAGSYSGHLHVKMPYFQERIVATLAGCITSIQAIYVPADDLTDPAPVVIFGHLDGITVPNQDRVVVCRATGLMAS